MSFQDVQLKHWKWLRIPEIFIYYRKSRSLNVTVSTRNVTETAQKCCQDFDKLFLCIYQENPECSQVDEILTAYRKSTSLNPIVIIWIDCNKSIGWIPVVVGSDQVTYLSYWASSAGYFVSLLPSHRTKLLFLVCHMTDSVSNGFIRGHLSTHYLTGPGFRFFQFSRRYLPRMLSVSPPVSSWALEAYFPATERVHTCTSTSSSVRVLKNMKSSTYLWQAFTQTRVPVRVLIRVEFARVRFLVNPYSCIWFLPCDLC